MRILHVLSIYLIFAYLTIFACFINLLKVCVICAFYVFCVFYQLSIFSLFACFITSLLNTALIAVVGLVTNARFLTSDPKNVAARAKLISYLVLAHPRNHLSGWASHSVNNSNLKSKWEKKGEEKEVLEKKISQRRTFLLYCQKPFIIKKIFASCSTLKRSELKIHFELWFKFKC